MFPAMSRIRKSDYNVHSFHCKAEKSIGVVKGINPDHDWVLDGFHQGAMKVAMKVAMKISHRSISLIKTFSVLD